MAPSPLEFDPQKFARSCDLVLSVVRDEAQNLELCLGKQVIFKQDQRPAMFSQSQITATSRIGMVPSTCIQPVKTKGETGNLRRLTNEVPRAQHAPPRITINGPYMISARVSGSQVHNRSNPPVPMSRAKESSLDGSWRENIESERATQTGIVKVRTAACPPVICVSP